MKVSEGGSGASLTRDFVLIGGGPAGLTAALELSRRGQKPRVLEATDGLGGLARTEIYRGFRFDMGGHRFFTKRPEIMELWRSILGDDFLKRPRLSRIFYRNRFFHYPLRIADTLVNLGPIETLAILSSYLWANSFPYLPETTFEHWVTNRFGRRLFRTFFESYTEKVWGVSCSELRAEWAAQRIKNLSVKTLLEQALTGRGQEVTSLIEEFHYPRLGPGMMWERAATRIQERGGSVETSAPVMAIEHEGGRVIAVRVGGEESRRVPGTDFISSMPLKDLIARLDPPPPNEVREAADQLRYRDFLTVCLVVDREDLFPDNWIYVHDSAVRVARIQNFKNWSRDMTPDSGKTSLGLEYFCTEGDSLWSLPDPELLALGKKELSAIGLAGGAEVRGGCVFRVPKAYPLYDAEYAGHLSVLREYLARFENLQTIGRNGLHRYNNQDHSMLTGIAAVRNALDGSGEDLWSLNAEPEYLETASRSAA